VASLGGRTAPGRVTPSREVITERKKFLWANLQRIVDERGRIGTKVRGDIGVTQQNWQTKKVVSFFQEKIGVTPSVAAPGDTHPIVTPLRTDGRVGGRPENISLSRLYCLQRRL